MSLWGIPGDEWWTPPPDGDIDIPDDDTAIESLIGIEGGANR